MVCGKIESIFAINKLPVTPARMGSLFIFIHDKVRRWTVWPSTFVLALDAVVIPKRALFCSEQCWHSQTCEPIDSRIIALFFQIGKNHRSDPPL